MDLGSEVQFFACGSPTLGVDFWFLGVDSILSLRVDLGYLLVVLAIRSQLGALQMSILDTRTLRGTSPPDAGNRLLETKNRLSDTN